MRGLFRHRLAKLHSFFAYSALWRIGFRGFGLLGLCFLSYAESVKKKEIDMHAKLRKRRETNPAYPDTPPGAALRAKILPQWMYRDPAEAIERIENIGLRAEARERIRDLEREQDAERVRRSLFERMTLGLRRVILAPPAIRRKRARIQALARAGMKERK